MKVLGLIWFILFLVVTFVYMFFDGYTNVTMCSLGITILCYLFYLGAKLEEKIDKLIDELNKKK